MQRIHESTKPLVGGNYAGVYSAKTGTWNQAPVAQPGWRRSAEGTAVGWIDPQTAIHIPPVHQAGAGIS